MCLKSVSLNNANLRSRIPCSKMLRVFSTDSTFTQFFLYYHTKKASKIQLNLTIVKNVIKFSNGMNVISQNVMNIR